jgi:hypothetical protein
MIPMSLSLRLQDELLKIYQSPILEHPSRLAPFISILRALKPVIRGGEDCFYDGKRAEEEEPTIILGR